MRKIKIVFLVLSLAFIALQFFRPTKNIASASITTDDISQAYTIPAEVQQLLQAACYDCHSNNTQYPWYTNIQPVGWFMAAHIKNGKADLNFNEFGKYSAKRKHNKLKRMKEQILSSNMPLPSYRLLHPEARLTTAQQIQIINWIDSTLNGYTK
ncbi:heme-binding domain-containing protein [Chitinophaga sp. Hz27]|uniref:heme-binding domain-containing protein n=1 Tax=Chitinophaga sp. Hz27 TaxID=3347169 RepID=UPI0035D8B31E